MNLKRFNLFCSRLRITIKRRIQALFQNTYNHYACFLPGKIGFLASFFLNFFFANINVNKSQTYQLKKLQEDGIVIYANKYKSYFEYLFYYTRYKQLGLPFPEIGLDYKTYSLQPASRIFKIFAAQLYYFFRHLSLPSPYKSGYIKNELLFEQRSAFLSLIGGGTFYRYFVKSRTDPIHYLVEMQKTINCPIYIVPQLMLFNIRPQRTNPTLLDLILGCKENPGTIRRISSLFKSPGKIFIEISKPVNLMKFLNFKEIREMDSRQQAMALRRHLLLQINRHRQSITGPVLKSREELIETILTNEELRSFMQSYARRSKSPLPQIHKKATEYLDEIAANYNLDLINIYKIGLKWILNSIFEGITVDHAGLEKVKLAAQRAPLILIPCHKSHLDYLILSYVFHNHNMPCPHIAAGKNLSFWPLGQIFRAGGAFFIRRTFKGAILYSKVFAAYVERLLSEGFNIEFFIEGGRSRTGKLLMPKLGMLSLLINACKKGICDDLIFIPIFIGYDRVLEEDSYLHEIEGGNKKPENLLQVIKARKFLKKRYGKVYIKFDQPISLKAHLDQKGEMLSDLSSKQQNQLCNKIGYRVINAINRSSVVTPHGIVAGAILTSPRNFSHEQLMFHVDAYMSYLLSQNATMADTLLVDPRHAFEHVLETFVQRKFVEKRSLQKGSEPSQSTFEANENRRSILEYYKNNCIAFFVPPAFTAMSILKNDAFQFSASDLHRNYKFLQEFFIHEFSPDLDNPPEYFVRKTIKFFIDEAILVPHNTLPDTYNLTSAGFRKLKVYAGLLKTYFESYHIVLTYFTQTRQDAAGAKDQTKKIQALGNKMYKNKEIERSEALSRINYGNAVTLFNAQGIKGAEDAQRIDDYATEVRSYLHHLSL